MLILNYLKNQKNKEDRMRSQTNGLINQLKFNKNLLIVVSKFILLIIFASLLVRCSSVSHYEKQVLVYGYDFTKYTNQGFLFTPEKYLGEYESIGLLTVLILPELNRSGEYDFSVTDKKLSYAPVSADEVLDSLFDVAINMGANAIVSLTIENIERMIEGVNAPGVKASGFAIRRIME